MTEVALSMWGFVALIKRSMPPVRDNKTGWMREVNADE
jgi:hypothetical protein